MLSMRLLKTKEVNTMDDFFDMDAFELAFALGMAETFAEEEIERLRIEREFEQDDEDIFDD